MSEFSLLETLQRAKQKLEIYRAHSTGEYKGGTEYTMMIRLLDDQIAKLVK